MSAATSPEELKQHGLLRWLRKTHHADLETPGNDRFPMTTTF
jgi:hypothetical protein